MTKMAFMGPKSLTPSLLRILIANPSLTTKMMQKKQMLTVTMTLVVFSSHGPKTLTFMIFIAFNTVKVNRNPMGAMAMRMDTTRRSRRYRRRRFAQTTCTCRTSELSMKMTTKKTKMTPAIEVA